VKGKDDLTEENRRLKARLAELEGAKKTLDAKLAEQVAELEVLKNSVRGLRELATLSADWYWEQDAEFRFVRFTGEQAAVVLDVERDSNIGKRRWELPGGIPLSGSWDDHRAVLEAHQPFRNFEYMRKLGDDLPHYLSVSGVPVFDSQNRFVGYRGTVHDITAIKRSEEAQRQASLFLDEVVDNIPIAFHLKAVQQGHRIVAWNKAAEALYGIPREETIGRTMHDLWPKAIADKMLAADLELAAGGVPQDFPDRIAYTRHRGTIHVHMRKVPLKDANGTVTHTLIAAEDITPHLEAEARLLHSQERFRNLTELSSDWYWETDDQFRFTVLSGGETEEDRRKISEHLGKTRWEIDPSPANKVLWENHRALLERHETFRNFEYERRDPDGSRAVLSISGEPFFDAQGQFAGYRGVGSDITERLVAQENLRRSEERFRSLTGLSSDWYWEQDKEFRNIFVSNDLARSGKGNQNIGEGQCRWDVPNSSPLVGTWEEHKALLAAHLPFRNFEYQLTADDGSVLFRSVSGEPVFGADGAFEGYRGVGADITARKQTEIALRTGEARFRTVVAALAEGVVLRDAEGRIVDCNASAERILGKTLAQMAGQTVAGPEWEMLREDGSLMPEEEHPNLVAKRTGLPQSNVVVCYRKPDGSILWGQLNVQPLFDESSPAPIGFVTTITDISNRKRAETEIVRLNVDLENRVLRRTAQLEAANKELEAFSYSVAHDLRSPLSAIDGYCALLQKAVPPESGERAIHYLTRIRGGVRRMGELTDGLLSLAQLSRTSLSWDVVDLSAEAARVIGQLAEDDASRNVKVSIEPGMLVKADTSLLRQVLENLIANAWKFTSKKERAEITVGKETGPDHQPVYFVRDNGAGFDMAYADKLFGTFQRLHSPDEFAGSGIGLATVKRIISRHGGRIWATAALGEGSTFYFTLGGAQNEALAAENSSEEDSSMALALPRSRHLYAGTANAAVGASGHPISSDQDAVPASDQFSNAFEHAAIGMALIAVDSRRLRVNSAFCQMLGYSEAEMLARTVQEITHPDDIEWDVLQRKRALAGEIETYNWEKRYLHKTGRIVWGHLTCSLVRDADRKPLHFISQVQDITERKESERTLRESEERFRALTELSSDWFWEQDENFRFVQISGELTHAHLTANTRERAIGKTRWELDNVNMDESVWAAHKAQLERHEVFRDFEITRLDAQGQLRYVAISGVPIFDASGRFTGYRGTGRDTTEMHRFSEALRASELQLRQITDTVPALIAYVDAEQRFRFHNRAYEEAFGLTHEQINGKTMLEVLGPEFYERVRPRVEEVMTGYPVVYERTQTTARGDQRTFVVNYFPRYGDGDEEGQVVGFYSLATDITQQKEAERILQESEERFRTLTQLSSDWFWEQDENFRFVEVKGKHKSPSASSNPQDSIYGKTPWELHTNMDPAILAEHKARHERHEAFRNFEFSRPGSNGEMRYMSVSGMPIFDADGRFAGYRSVGRDTTEVRRFSDALRASERQLREITDTVPALIAYVDKEQHFRFHNRAYEEAFGLSYEQFDGKHLRDVMGDEFYEKVRPHVEEVLTGYPVAYERTGKTPRGEIRDYVVNYFPRYGDGEEEGEVIGFYSMATDITELKRIDRMKSEFVSTVSHELRTPLTSIRGSLGLISGGVAGQLPDAVKTLVGIAKNNCERLIRLINDILDIEKIESGKMSLNLEVVELRPLMVQVLAANEGFGTAQNVGLSLNFPDDEIRVNVDSDRLVQVVTNLLSNAMKFSPPGSVVEVHVLHAGASVRVEVRDRGPGIPEEFRNRIFQKFSQADSSDTRQKGGTGLGLNISRAIIERLGGSIGFSTEPGVGTTFFFELPEWKELPTMVISPESRGPARPRILICEDDRDIARLIGMMLDKGGFDSDMVFSAAQALVLLEKNRYAAMTVDLKLPDQDGIALIRMLRKQESTRDLPIVVVSAMAGEGQIAFNNQPLTVSDWLDKPIDENLLVLGMRRAIDGMAAGKPRILHVEDDLDIQRITAAIVQDFATFEFAATLEEARARLLGQRFDLVLLDLTLPGGSGWDLVADIEALDHPPPVVVFSASEVSRGDKSRAAAVLIKAQTSNEELLQTLQRVLAQDRASGLAPLA
jgi:PAS domain S-box-containing protein